MNINETGGFEFKQWTVGKIEGSMIDDLERRERELVWMIKTIEDEKEFILHILNEKKLALENR